MRHVNRAHNVRLNRMIGQIRSQLAHALPPRQKLHRLLQNPFFHVFRKQPRLLRGIPPVQVRDIVYPERRLLDQHIAVAEHLDFEVIVAAQQRSAGLGAVVLVVCLARVDDDGLEGPGLDFVVLVLDPAVAFVEVCAGEDPVAAREAVVLEVELGQGDGLAFAVEGQLDRGVDFAESLEALLENLVGEFVDSRVFFVAEKVFVVVRVQLDVEAVRLNKAGDDFDHVGSFVVAHTGFDILVEGIDEVVSTMGDFAVTSIVGMVLLLHNLCR